VKDRMLLLLTVLAWCLGAIVLAALLWGVWP